MNQLTLWEVRTSAFTQHGGCTLHDEAYDLLIDDWQRLGDLKTERLDYHVFEDLVFWGYADFLVATFGRYDDDGHFKARYCHIFYRRGTGQRDGFDTPLA